MSLYDIAEFHILFERIHPFADGNGRIGRLLMAYQAIQNNIVPPLKPEILMQPISSRSQVSPMTTAPLQTLSGFQNAWLGNQADKANISALMSNKSIAQMLSSTKMFTPHESDLFLLPGIRYEVAAEKIF